MTERAAATVAFASSAKTKAAIKASKTTVKKGKKSVIKIKSDTGAKLTLKAANSAARRMLKKKYITVKVESDSKLPYI